MNTKENQSRAVSPLEQFSHLQRESRLAWTLTVRPSELFREVATVESEDSRRGVSSQGPQDRV